MTGYRSNDGMLIPAGLRVTGYWFYTGFNNSYAEGTGSVARDNWLTGGQLKLYPIRGGFGHEHEVTNYFALRDSGAFAPSDNPLLHSYD